MKIVVTGGCGRLGGIVVDHLLDLGHQVIAADRRYRPSRGQVKITDLRQREAAYDVLAGAQAVVHLGNHPGPMRMGEQTMYAENCAINVNVFEAASDLGVEHMLYASSVQAIRGERDLHKHEPSSLPYLPLDQAVPPDAGNPYAASKVAAEVMLAMYHQMGRFKTAVSLRFPRLVEEREYPWVFHGLRNRRDNYPVGDDNEVLLWLRQSEAARLIGAILHRPPPGYRAYLAAEREPKFAMSIPEVIQRYYSNVPLRRPAEEMTSLVDMSQIEQEVGWTLSPLPDVGEPAGGRPRFMM